MQAAGEPHAVGGEQDALPRRHPARLVSIALHPFVMFAALALVATWRIEPALLPRAAMGMATAIVVVAVFIWQRRRSGRWQTVDASRPHERPMLYVLALLVVAGYWLWMGGRGSGASTGVLSALAMLLVAAVANRWIKLSLHMASLVYAGIVLLHLLWPMGIVALACAPLLAWARVRMARHTLPEVLGGAGLGATAGLVTQALG